MAKKSGKTVPKRDSVKAVKPNLKKPSATKKTVESAEPRRLKSRKTKFSRATKPTKPPAKLPSVWKLTKTTAQTLWLHKRLFAGISLVYGFLNLILVQGSDSSAAVAGLKDAFSQISNGHFGSLGSSLATFTALAGSADDGSSQTAGAYRFFLALIASLALIWALRQVLAGTSVRIRDAFYRGMYPLIPFILVLLIIGLQLIPLILGASLFAFVMGKGIAVYFIEKLVWTIVYGLLALWSFYLLSTSLFALYVVTLPDMTPLKALRTARRLVRYRRWAMVRKIMYLPLMLFVAAGIIMVPIIVWVTPLAPWVFFLLSMCLLTVIHAYMYTLYRELLNDQQ